MMNTTGDHQMLNDDNNDEEEEEEGFRVEDYTNQAS
jgi:hypothetical protein